MRKANIISTSWFPDSYILALWGTRSYLTAVGFRHVGILDDSLPTISGVDRVPEKESWCSLEHSNVLLGQLLPGDATHSKTSRTIYHLLHFFYHKVGPLVRGSMSENQVYCKSIRL